MTVLHRAAQYAPFVVVRHLLKKGAKKDVKGFPISSAVALRKSKFYPSIQSLITSSIFIFFIFSHQLVIVITIERDEETDWIMFLVSTWAPVISTIAYYRPW